MREYAKYEEEKYRIGVNNFVQTMPKSMRDFFGPILPHKSSACIEDISERYGKIPENERLRSARAALSDQYPKMSEQVSALLEWNGKIIDKRLSFQSFPTELLLEYDPNYVLFKTRESSVSSAQWIGICRYYSNLHFRYKFPQGYTPLDKKLQTLIIQKVKATGKNSEDVESFEMALRNWCD